jgi:hypothetical protein
LAEWLNDRHIKHLRGAPDHPMTQGKIERWHQTLKNRVLSKNFFLPGDLEAQIAAFIDDYNQPPIPRKHRQSHPRRGLLRARPDGLGRTTKDQTTDDCIPSLAAPSAGG